jgi:hypothetical protein
VAGKTAPRREKYRASPPVSHAAALPRCWQGGELADGRIYICGECGQQVVVCSRCDRGQRYCSRECSRAARRCSVREAGARYQRSERGRLHHARRQKLYRFRKAGFRGVTHQGSLGRGSSGSLALCQSQGPSVMLFVPSYSRPRCRFCGFEIPGGFVRTGFRVRRGGSRDHPGRCRC